MVGVRANVLVALGGDSTIIAPRAFASCRFDTSLSYTGLFVATAMTGKPRR